MVKFEQCVTSIFTLIALLLFYVTNVSADSGSQSFKFSYVKGAPTSQTDMTLTLVPQNSREIIINVSQLTEGNTFICKFIWYISF